MTGDHRLSERECLALEAAAAGMTSGRLEEWPILAAAFRALGQPTLPCTGAVALKARAQEILGRTGAA